MRDRAREPPIQQGYDPGLAAPMICSGITVYSPVKHYGVGPGTKVGVLGIGGPGHLAIQIAKVIRARITEFRPGEGKCAEAAALGRDEFVGTTGMRQWTLRGGRGRFT